MLYSKYQIFGGNMSFLETMNDRLSNIDRGPSKEYLDLLERASQSREVVEIKLSTFILFLKLIEKFHSDIANLQENVDYLLNNELNS